MRFLAAVFALIFLFSGSVLAQESALRQTFQKLYDERDRAFMRKDAPAMAAQFADDFTSKDQDGSIKSRAEVVQLATTVTSWLNGLPIAATMIESIKQSNSGNTAILEVSERAAFTMTPPDGQRRALEMKGRSRDTWVRTGGTWKVKLHEVLEQTTLIDGKPAPAATERPGPPAGSAGSNDPGTRPSAPNDRVVTSAPVAVEFEKWVEPKEHSFTIEVPRGWQVKGGVNWTGPVDAQRFIRAKSPDGAVLIFIGDPNILPQQVPDPTTPREGMEYKTPLGGSVMIQRFMKGSEYARQYVMQGRPCENAPQWVEVAEIPDLVASVTQALEPQMRAYNLNFNVTAGEAGFDCGKLQGLARGVTVLAGSPGSSAKFWMIVKVGGFLTADPMRAMQARYIMNQMMGTMVDDPDWLRAYEDKIRTKTGEGALMQQAEFAVQQNASRRAANDLSRLNHPNEGVATRPGARIADSSGNMRMCDAIGRSAVVSNTSGPVFMDHSGNVRQGSSSGAPPDNTGVWSPATRCP